MHWIAAHLYVSFVAFIGLIFLGGAVLVQRQSTYSPSATATTWTGAGGFAFLGGGGDTAMPPERIRTEDLLKGQGVAQHSILPIGTSLTQEPVAANEFDWQSLLDQLSPPGTISSQTQTVETPLGTTEAYSYIPRGLISTALPATNQTPLQVSLYEYGNQAGAFIRNFDDTHTTMIQILKNAYEDRTNPQKLAAAIQIGKDYQQLGLDLEEMSNVPPAIQNMHLALARAYQEAGRKTVVKLETKTDEEFLTAMYSYNDTVLEFTRRYVAIVQYFSAAGVQFSKQDPGSVFMFQVMGEM